MGACRTKQNVTSICCKKASVCFAVHPSSPLPLLDVSLCKSQIQGSALDMSWLGVWATDGAVPSVLLTSLVNPPVITVSICLNKMS